MNNHLMQSIIILSAICVSPFVNADVIRFHNGDIISGKITFIGSDHIKFKPAITKKTEIKIKLSELKNLETDRQMTVELKDGTVSTGQINLNTSSDFTVSNALVSEPQKTDISHLDKAYIGTPDEYYGLKTNGYVKGGFSFLEGNSDAKTYDLDTRFIAEADKSRITINAEYGFSEEESNKTRDRAWGGLKYDYFFAPKVYAYVNTDFERDKIEKLALRSSLGSGLGYQFYNQDDLHLNIEAGPSFVNEDYTVTGRDNNFAAFRWGSNYDQQLFDTMTIFHNHRGLQSLEVGKDTVINAKTGVRIPIYEALQASFEWRFDWNNNPPTGAVAVDNTYISTLGYYF